MKTIRGKSFWLVYLGMMLALYAQKPTRVENPRTHLQREETGIVRVLLSWDANAAFKAYHIEASNNLVDWAPLACYTKEQLGDPDADGRHTVVVGDYTGGSRFFRIAADLASPPVPPPFGPAAPAPETFADAIQAEILD